MRRSPRGASLRAWVQWALLTGFLLLFVRTAYRGSDLLDWPVHLAFRLDPLAALAELLAGGEVLTWLWLAAGLTLLFTALLGRFFCGWACPLGTLLEVGGRGLRRLFARRGRVLRPPAHTGALVFGGLLAAALLGLPLLGFFDPLSLLLRSLTLALHPAADAAAKGVLGAAERAHLPVVSSAAGGVYDFLKPLVLSFDRPAFLLAGLTALLLTAVVGLELLAPRFWCAHLCPLGALLGVAARVSPLRRGRAGECGACRACSEACPTGAASADPADPSLCVACGSCEDVCPRSARLLRLSPLRPRLPSARVRRALLASAGVGAAAALVPRVRAEERERPLDFLRPPGAVPEEAFVRRCVRCGACMRVCPRGALHPTLLEAGLGGLWTPRLVPRLGYCEFHCRLCGQVCPTGAIAYLEEGQKEKWVLGTAVFDLDRCLPYRKAQECMVCEEHCPTAPKAIVFREEGRADPEGGEKRVKVPRVVEKRCVGCGICETKCPLPGRAAIRVVREKPESLEEFY